MKDTSELYRPSNGSCGECFRAVYCDNCKHDINHDCGIYLRTLVHNISDPEYPREWIKDGPIKGKCTAFEPMEAAE